MQSRPHQSRCFIVTFNNPEDHGETCLQSYLEDLFVSLDAKYITGQLELGSSGTLHYQFAVHLHQKLRFDTLQRRLPHTHIEIVRFDNGIDSYCNKEETRIEGPISIGTPPRSGRPKKTTVR